MPPRFAVPRLRSTRSPPAAASGSTLTSTRTDSTSSGVSEVHELRWSLTPDVRDLLLTLATAFGYSCSVVAPDDSALSAMASRGASAIRAVSGTAYTIGNACRALYATTGDSTDYLHGVAKSTYTYTLELRDKGTNGFSLPASQIQPTVRETWAGVLAMLRAA